MASKLNNQMRNLKIKTSGKQRPTIVSNVPAHDDEQATRELQFRTELLWCQRNIQDQLEKSKNDRQLRLLQQGYAVLIDHKSSLVRKRQIMSQLCGDYRKTMSSEVANEQSRQVRLYSIRSLSKQFDLFKQLDLRWLYLKKCHSRAGTNAKPDCDHCDEFKFNF